MLAFPPEAGSGRRGFIRALLVIWFAAVCDLFLTHSQAGHPAFAELNPLAAPLVEESLLALAVYKFGLLGGATALLLALRAYRASHWGAWFLAGTHGLLLVYWGLYWGIRGF